MAEITDLYKLVFEFDDSDKKKVPGLQKSFTELNQALEIGKKAFAGVTTALNQTFDALNKAQVINGVSAGFDTLQTKAGLLADDSLQKLRNSTQGLISDFELMQSANQAVQLGLDPSKLDVMAEAATKLGLAVGRDAGDAFDDLVTGVGRASPLILDNLGITLKAEEAYKIYAASIGVSVDQLNSAQKAEAFQVAALEKITEKAKELAGVQIDAAAAAKQFQTTVENLTNEFVVGLSRSDSLRDAFQGLSDAVDDIDFATLGEITGDVIAAFVTAISTTIELTKKLGELIDDGTEFIPVLDELVDFTKSYYQSVQESNKQLKEFRDKINDAAKDLNSAAGLNKGLANLALITDEVNKSLKDTVQEINNVIGQSSAFSAGLAKLGIPLTDSQKKLADLIDSYEQLSDKKKIAVKRSSDLEQRLKVLTGEIDKTGDAGDKASEKIEKLADEFAKFEQKVIGDDLAKQFELAVENLNEADLKILKQRILENFSEGLDQGAEKFIGTKWEGRVDELNQILIDKESAALDDVVAGKRKEIAEEHAEDLKEAYQNSVEFWNDIFLDTINGSTFDLEVALKKVAAGFAAEIAAGIVGIPSVTSAQGLGGVLANTLGLGGGAGGIGLGGGVGAGLGSLGIGSAGAQIGLAGQIGGAAALFNGISAIGQIGNGSQANIQSGATLAGTAIGAFFGGPLGAGIGSIVGNVGGDFLGGLFGGGGPSPEQLKQFAFLDNLEQTLGGKTFDTTFGQSQNIHEVDPFNFDVNTPILGDIGVQLEGISNVLGGGDDDLSDRIQFIIAQLTTGFEDGEVAVGSFNEALVNVQSFMGDIGLTTEAAKDQLTNLFLEGEVSLSEFGDSIQSLNQLARDNLVGEGSVGDAIDILSKNIEENPKAALKGLELAFKEAAEVSEDQLGFVQEYLSARFGPDAAEAFESLKDIGITTWEDIRDANTDEIFAIFSALEEFNLNAVNDMGDAAVQISDLIQKPFDDVQEKVKDTGDTIEKTLDESSKKGTDDFKNNINPGGDKINEFIEIMNSLGDSINDVFAVASGKGVDFFINNTDPAVLRIENIKKELGITKKEAEKLLGDLAKIPNEKTVTIKQVGVNELNQQV